MFDIPASNAAGMAALRYRAAMTLAKYLKVFDIGLQNTFVYRWNFLLRSLFQPLDNGLIQIAF